MKKVVKIGNKLVGDREPTFIIAEIGINHNGSMETTRNLIDVAARAGCDAVKFQKRTPELCVPENQKNKLRDTPWGEMTYLNYKYRIEFEQKEYEQIDEYCEKKDVLWFASCWDKKAVDFIDQFNPPCYKIASASLTDDELLEHIRSKGKPIILSTGMSDLPMIEHAVSALGKKDLILLHCTSVYPIQEEIGEGYHGLEMLNLEGIRTLKKKFNIPIGFSSHDAGIMPTYASVVMGASVIEKHVTLHKAMWGSDQAISTDPRELEKLCRMVREFAVAKGDGIIRIYPEEAKKMKELRQSK